MHNLLTLVTGRYCPHPTFMACPMAAALSAMEAIECI